MLGSLCSIWILTVYMHHVNVLWHPKKEAYLCAPAGYKLFQHANLLASLLEPYPMIKIVLSTVWGRCPPTGRSFRRDFMRGVRD